MKPEVVYLPDDSIDDAGDCELRELLSTCFTKPGDEVFKARRYWREPYRHRWVIRNEERALIAHVGVHQKIAEAEGERLRNEAMQGSGGNVIVALEAAKNLNLSNATFSTLHVDLLDVDAMVDRLGLGESK